MNAMSGISDIALANHRAGYLPSWAQPNTSSQDEYDAALDRFASSVSGGDLINELVDVEDLLSTLAAADEFETIGRVVVAVHEAYAERLADAEVFGSLCRNSRNATQAAKEILAFMAQRKAQGAAR